MTFFVREPAAPREGPGVEVRWEECACLLCGGREAAPLVEAPDRGVGGDGLWFMVVQCQDCGLAYTNPRPAEIEMGRFYPDDYKPHRPPAEDEAAAKGPGWWRAWNPLANRLDLYRKALPKHGNCRLLDFGCGAGSFLARMRRQGWQATGIDESETAVEAARRQGLHAVAGTLPHPALADGSFDVVTLWQSLEHVRDPLAVLRAAHKLLAPGGRLIVATPNIDSLAFRWFGSAWNGLDLPRHLVHFTPHTLRLMLHRAGFKVGKCHMARRGSWIRASAGAARRHFPEPSRWHRWLQTRMLANLVSWYGYMTRQSDCILCVAEKR